MSIIISIDLGTTKICTAGIDSQTLRPLAVTSRANDADIAPLPTGLHEQCPQRIWRIVCELIVKLLSGDIAADSVSAVAISGQMHGVMLVDESGNPVGNFMTWRDRRGKVPPWAKQFAELNGCELHTGYGGATLACLADESKIPHGTKALSLADFIAYKLSGRIATENTHAASWGIYDIAHGRWNSDMREKLNIPAEILCEVLPSGGELGKLDEETSQLLGLPSDVKVCSPVGDNQASVIGASGFFDTAMVLNLGTGGQVSIPCRQGNYRAGFETRPMPAGGFIHVGASLCGGWSYNYLKNFCGDMLKKLAGVELSDGEIYAKLNELAASAGDTKGLRVDTRFAGIRGNGEIRGAISGMDTNNFTIENLSLGFLEGMVRELYAMAGGLMNDIDSVVGSGNAIRKNPLMPGLITKIFGKNFIPSMFEEEAAVGAAASAAVGLGMIDRSQVSELLRSE